MVFIVEKIATVFNKIRIMFKIQIETKLEKLAQKVKTLY